MLHQPQNNFERKFYFVSQKVCWMSASSPYWTVVGFQHYAASTLNRTVEVVLIRKYPIENHPWNIAVFCFKTGAQIGTSNYSICFLFCLNAIGTLNKVRIQRIWENFSSQGLTAQVEFLNYSKLGLRPNLIKVMPLLNILSQFSGNCWASESKQFKFWK